MDTENPETNEISLTGGDAPETGVPAENSAVPAPKRRGRPPKNPDASAAPVVKRPRGRPRKTSEAPAAENLPSVSVPAPEPEIPDSPVPAVAPAESPSSSESVSSSGVSSDVPAPKKSLFSFDPEDDRESVPAKDAPEAEPSAGVPAPAPDASPAFVEDGKSPFPSVKPVAPRPWEKKDRPWQQKKQWEPRGNENAGGGFAPQNGGKPWEKKDRPAFPPRPQQPKFGGGKFNAQGKFEKFRGNDKAPAKRSWGELANTDSAEEASLSLGAAYDYNLLNDEAYLDELSRLARHVAKRADGAFAVPPPAPVDAPAAENASADSPVPASARAELLPDLPAATIDFNEVYESSMSMLIAAAKSFGIPVFRNPVRRPLVKKILRAAFAESRPIAIRGTLEMLADGNGLLLYGCDSYRVKELSAFVPQLLIKKFGLQRGHDIEAIAYPPMKGETAPIVVHIRSIAGADPETVKDLTPFTELTPYYPTERIMLETDETVEWNNLSMRCVDLLCPIGLGQRGLIVAPPRTGKTVLLQAIANSIAKNKPDAHLIVLLVDERPEEVTDFKRKTKHGEVISSTFDENAENHVHVAEMVIERARRMVELGKDVIILLDSITRLARAYNTLMPNGGKILSGGVEAGALSKPKRFFGSARNIENGGSLTILGTALIDTGSKMDEVIFEEFKGTGNMELDLDRDLANKRIYPAINFERSGTRKEELLYHPQEMQCVYSMRRAMKGVPSIEAMEMLISRMKKTKTNAEFLMTLAGR